MDNWYLLYSKPREESRAQQQLANQGFESFVPQITLKKIQAGKTVLKTEPLFPRYIFLKPNSGLNLSVVRSTRGVAGFVKFGQALAQVPASLVHSLLTQQIQQQAKLPEHPFKAGDKVEILSGPFAHLNAVFQQAEGESRSLILLSFLGQQLQLSMDNSNLVANH
ncbi:transcription/translation regulatory transformer protein RfaH [Alishewanella sp. d11]|uniref:transcription/translation regulatory transformer protein RfaH n=1 Tax=Alishewanella sp. d11 TaxID=3414030 RepID=UPI003BF8F553